MTHIWIVTMHETPDSVALGVDFPPEAYASESLARERHAALQARLDPHSGLYYALDCIPLCDDLPRSN